MCSLDWFVYGGMVVDKRGLEENYFNMIKDKCGKFIVSIIFKSERRGAFCLEKG